MCSATDFALITNVIIGGSVRICRFFVDYRQSSWMWLRMCDLRNRGDSGGGGTGGVFGEGGMGRALTAAQIEELYTPRGRD